MWNNEAISFQDKSSCLAPQTVQQLLAIDQDVVHVNVGTGITTGHLASLLRHTSPHSHIWGFGVDSADKAKKAAKNLEFLGVKSILFTSYSVFLSGAVVSARLS